MAPENLLGPRGSSIAHAVFANQSAVGLSEATNLTGGGNTLPPEFDMM